MLWVLTRSNWDDLVCLAPPEGISTLRWVVWSQVIAYYRVQWLYSNWRPVKNPPTPLQHARSVVLVEWQVVSPPTTINLMDDIRWTPENPHEIQKDLVRRTKSKRDCLPPRLKILFRLNQNSLEENAHTIPN